MFIFDRLLGCKDTCQMWMWFKKSSRYFYKIKNLASEEINKWNFSNPNPWLAMDKDAGEATLKYIEKSNRYKTTWKHYEVWTEQNIVWVCYWIGKNKQKQYILSLKNIHYTQYYKS